jgi:hypothetical protein
LIVAAILAVIFARFGGIVWCKYWYLLLS